MVSACLAVPCLQSATPPTIGTVSAPCIHVRPEGLPQAGQMSSRLQALAYSSNWAGYAISKIGTSQVLDIWGQWTVPTVSSSSPRPAYSSAWIGVGGFNTQDLIQTGTAQEIDSSGNMRYYAWYEILPASLVSVFNVNPGDIMNATIQYQGSGQWHVVIHDLTTPNGWDQTISYASSFSSAEWIFEATTINNRLATLPQTSDTIFYGASAYIGSKNNLGFFSPTQLLMVDTSTLDVKAQPGPLPSPDRFAVTYTWNLPQVPPTFVNCSITPASVAAGSGFQAQYYIYNPNSANINVGLGASIRNDGTLNEITDPSNDVVASISPGSGLYKRAFNVPAGASQGTYDFALNLSYGTPGKGSEYATSGWSAAGLQVSGTSVINPLTTASSSSTTTITSATTTSSATTTTTSTYPPSFNQATIISFTVNKPSPQQAGSSITFTCTANSPNVSAVIQYRFWRLKVGGAWGVVQEWSSLNVFTWKTTSADLGGYQFVVWVRDGYRVDVNSRDDLSFWNVNGKSQTSGSTYTIQAGPPTSTPSVSNAPPCIIATAAYGSGLAPEVAYMRLVRDEMIGSNRIGRILVNGWNSFYYSWSPTVAGWIASSNSLQATFRILLLPLVGTIHATAFIYNAVASINPTSASVIAFLFAAFSSTTLYILSPLFALTVVAKRIRRSRLAMIQEKSGR